MATIEQSPEAGMRTVRDATSYGGLPNPITVFQRPTDDRTRDLDAQAGGFWRSRREWRKAL
ncbi:hypothetical protein RS3R6_33460 [Pseudomonas atacamensis]|uniref:Uncharacterized protein n=1 Tax=Pseudomonas atacamensis TaxID=2565368 RepID=A0ABQ5PIM7_9PSED|nr:hypothetical protein RS3R1_24190 [Pseudomonas atacamensis]GLH55164.1 hypothetical protein RS3R6_33460 [Pseudomonas atacamensis]